MVRSSGRRCDPVRRVCGSGGRQGGVEEAHRRGKESTEICYAPAVTEWPRERVFKLIELYREQTVLWDPTCREFKDKNLKNSAWTEIALAMKLSRSEVSKRV
ncbi:hypothetical protein J6590_030176 [Homalodisca vitripennis]|nr:hypothetical protein J6590_030176 [Homalodisca vitripennis]